MNELVSKYKNNSVASAKKHIFSRLLDYFSIFVVAYIIFSFATSIANNFPIMQDISKQLNAVNKEAITFVDESKLQSIDEQSGNLISIESGALKYVENLAKTNSFVYGIKYKTKNGDGTIKEVDVPKEETFINDLLTYQMDNLSFYYYLFKTTHEGLNNYVYEDEDYAGKKDILLYEKLMTYNSSFFVNEVPSKAETANKYIIFTEENAQKLINRVGLADTSDPIANEIYTMVTNGYIKAIQYGINDVENNSVEYKEINTRFVASYERLTAAMAMIYFISYLLGYFILHLIVSLVSKEWTTLGQKVMGLGMSNKNEMEVPIWKQLLYHLINLILFSSSMVIGFYLVGSFGVMSLHVTPHITLFGFAVAILTLNLVSLVLPLFMKTRDDLSTLILRLSLRDKKEFETSPEVLEMIENGDNDDSKSAC